MPNKDQKYKIPIMQPVLPEHKFILPYMQEIDKNRWYSNFGPLVVTLEKRFSSFMNMEEGTVVTTSSGTSGLTNCLRALNLPRGSFCLMPSWTFIATPASALAAGLIPYFIDIDANTWAIEPDTIKDHLKKIPGKVSSIMVVSPFGAPINCHKWDIFTDETGISVVIDGAAAFDTVTIVDEANPGKTPIVISLHTTKVLGIGEGGIVICSDKSFIQKVRELSNFGFSGERKIKLPGTNAKMSEYTAAVGMAALDLWDYKREIWMRLKLHYINAFNKVFGESITSPWLLSNEWVSSVCNITLPAQNAAYITEALAKHGIQVRQWWGEGCHKHPAYENYPRLDLPVTEKLGKSVLGLPFSIDLDRKDIDYIVQTLSEVVDKA